MVIFGSFQNVSKSHRDLVFCMSMYNKKSKCLFQIIIKNVYVMPIEICLQH